jgi:pyruvate/2-oxoglutarate dehydrogenase complex dihydrolipoamide acyltransferase (E2) component
MPSPALIGGAFLFRRPAAARSREGLRVFAKRVQILGMDGVQQAAIHQALVSVQHAVTSMTFASCDQEDLIEAIDRVEEQLHASHPNLALMCRFLNSIARSLRAQPEARDCCLVIEDAIGKAGMPSTWQSGI